MEQPVKYHLLTQRYTQEAVKFIRSSAGRPFFVYLAHNLPHIPIGTSDQFKGHSRATRVPGIVRWPGTIRAGRVSADMVSVMDWLPTFVALAGGRVTHQVDGVDQSAFLRGTGPDARTELFEFSGATIQVVRQGSWKLRIGPPENAPRGGRGRADATDAAAAAARGAAGPTAAAAPEENRGAAAPPAAVPAVELFNVDTDPAERLNVASAHPDIVEKLRARIQEMQAEVNASAPRLSAAAARFMETVSWID